MLSRPARAGRPAPPPFGKYGGANHTFHSMDSTDSMTSPFSLTIDWFAFTLPTASARETMEVLGGDWTKAWTLGVTPFIAADLAKAVLAVAAAARRPDR